MGHKNYRELMRMPADVRCYNGAFDSKSAAAIRHQENAMHLLRSREPEAHITYFPVEAMFQAHVWGRPLSGMRATKADAIADALDNTDPKRRNSELDNR